MYTIGQGTPKKMKIIGVTFQFSGEFVGKENIGQLAVCVGQHTVVAAPRHQ
jgi:hypothetical protein